MRTFAGRVAVVTGGGGGIGRGIAVELARQGCRLALVDIDEDGIQATAREIASVGGTASSHVCDVSDSDAMRAMAEQVVDVHSAVHILVNNAGVSVAGRFEDQSLENFQWIMGVNFWGAVHGCRWFLPYLRQAEEAHITNVCSEFGMLGCPTKSAYCATKFALRGFTESLRAELSGTSIGVTCAYPGAVATNIVHRGRVVYESKRALEAAFLAKRGIPTERAGRRIVRAIRGNQGRVFIGRDSRLFDVASRLAPGLSQWAMGRLHRRVPFLG